MKKVEITLYSFNELNKEAQERAIHKHFIFLESTPVSVEDGDGVFYDEYQEYSREDVIENILVNAYYYFADGEMAHCVTYDGGARDGETEFYHHGEIIPVS